MTPGFDPDQRSVVVLWRGERGEPSSDPAQTRFNDIFAAFAERGVRAEPLLYHEDDVHLARGRLLGAAGELVFVDPIIGGQDRALLDELLREVSAAGVFVTAHPM